MLDIDSPAVDAIFSPATAAAEKIIFKINPTESPIPISDKISINKLNPCSFWIFGTLITGNKNIVSDSDDDADCTIKTSATALKDMQSGDLNPMTAVMSGKVKISGDMGLAMKIQSLMN